jgi:hypothetical protein
VKPDPAQQAGGSRPPGGCTTTKLALPLAVSIMLAVAGLAAHLLPPVHLMGARRQHGLTLT